MNRKRSLILTLTAVGSVLVGSLLGSLVGEHSRALAQPVRPLVTVLDEPKVQAHRFLLVDDAGRNLASLGAGDETPALNLWDVFGGNRGTLGVDDDDAACLYLFPESGAASFAAGVSESTATYAIVYNPDGTHAWSVPADMPQFVPDAPATTGIPTIEPTAPPGPAQPTQTLEYDEVRALEYIARDMEKHRSIHLYTSTEGGYPRAIFFDSHYQAPRVMLSVNEGGEADIRLLDRMGKIRLLFMATPDSAGWVLMDPEGKPLSGFLTSQSADFPPVQIPADK